jgi:SAM-dependent methyltransferase
MAPCKRHSRRIPAMLSAELRSREVYEEWHQSVESESSTTEPPWYALVARHLTPREMANRRILEIGCGRGELASRLVVAGGDSCHVVAADFAQSAVRLARGRLRNSGRSRVSCMVASIQEIPVEDEAFDIVISCETVEHVVDPLPALREIRRVLRPGGRLLLTTPNYLGPMGLYRAYLRARGRRYSEGDQPICHFTTLPRTLMWLYRAGLTVRHVDAKGHYLLRPGRLPHAIDWLDSIPWLRWFALHSFVIADKP